MSFIVSFGTANPPNRLAQQVVARFMARVMSLDPENTRRLEALYRATGIETRYSVLGDYGRQQGYDFFPDNKDLSPFPTTRQRLALFKRHAVTLSVAAVQQCFETVPLNKSEVTHLVVVSCTGMYAPGLDIDLVKALGLNPAIHRTCINFMGCYAAFNALKLADAFCCADPKAKVLVVCTELCSIHFQKENTEDNLLANALFGDGSAALLIESQAHRGVNLKPTGFRCGLATEGEEDMAWAIGDVGFEMKLSTYVPAIIRGGITALTKELLGPQVVSDIAFFAIHPGGRKILEVIEEELKIGREQNRHAYDVLRNYGNMSSPTVLFVLRDIVASLTPADHGKKILSFAFGPGLTLESALLQIEFR